MSSWQIAFLITVFVGNALVTWKLLASKETTVRKWLFLVAIWLFPIFGASLVLIGISSAPVSPSNSCRDSNIPWGGGSQ